MSYEDELWEQRPKPTYFFSVREQDERFLKWAMQRNDWKTIDLFLTQKDANVLPRVIKAMKHGYLSLAQWFVANGENVDAVDTDGRTALHRAAMRRETEKVRLLIALKANVNLLDLWEETPLMKACIGAPVPDNQPIIQLLLAAGADTKIKGTNGCTVFDYESCPTKLIRRWQRQTVPIETRQRS